MKTHHSTVQQVESLISEPFIEVARVIPRTNAEGPGTRFAVWVQGCAIRCDGCFNPHLWARHGGTSTTPADLAEQVFEARVQGVTLLGGEPTDQAAALASFAALVQAAGLSVMTFTGHTLEQLHTLAKTTPAITDLLKVTDLLVDGPYLADHPDPARPWVGSTNQQFHFFTDRYKHLENTLVDHPDRIEVRVTPAGEVSINGWATVDQLESLLTEGPLVSHRRGRAR